MMIDFLCIGAQKAGTSWFYTFSAGDLSYSSKCASGASTPFYEMLVPQYEFPRKRFDAQFLAQI